MNVSRSLCLWAGLAVVASIVAAGCIEITIGGTTSEEAAQSVPDELIVAARSGPTRAELETAFSQASATIRSEMSELGIYLLGFEAGQKLQVQATLVASDLIEDVSENTYYQDQRTPNDPDFTIQWYLDAINARAAWDISTGDQDIIVAVLDTGVQTDHPDLKANMLDGVNVYDVTAGIDDTRNHGTGVAGIIGATCNNRIGGASVGWGTSILPIRVTDSRGRATSWAIAAGMRTAVGAGARVINISFAPLASDRMILRHAQFARRSGTLVVIAAGNTGRKRSDKPSDYALFVSATMRTGTRAPFSTYGTFVDIAAPGMSIYTAGVDDSYGSMSGTSFAAPIVAGVAALIWAVSPDLRPITVAEILTETAEDIGATGDDEQFGAGLIDAQAAVLQARQIQRRHDDDPPDVTITSPSDGATIKSRAAVRVTATDRYDVADVTLLINGLAIAADTIEPYQFVIDPSKFAPGEHDLTVEAVDTSGNVGLDTIMVVFAGSGDIAPPSIRITSPQDGDTVRGIVTIMAVASDGGTLTTADVLIHGEVLATIPQFEAATTIAHNWNASGASPGLHTVAVRATDAAGNEATDSIRVTVTQ